jgi:hypothetical protein
MKEITFKEISLKVRTEENAALFPAIILSIKAFEAAVLNINLNYVITKIIRAIFIDQ